VRYLLSPSSLIQGPKIGEYETRFARQIGARYAFSFSSARVGLYGILKALDIQAGDEVLLQVPTHIVVANAIRYAGARPVYVDCQADTFNMDLRQAERRLTPRTRVLLVQHTFGIPTEMKLALSFARRHGLVLLEDCVHALGSTFEGGPLGSFGRASFFSTEETKTISSTMGGMAVTDDPTLAERLRRFQQSCAWPDLALTAKRVLKLVAYHVLMQPPVHRWSRSLYEAAGSRNPLPAATAREEQYGKRPLDYEQRLSNVQAALALRQLERLAANLEHRKTISRRYGMFLARAGFPIPRTPANSETVFVRYPVWVADRQAAIDALSRLTLVGTWFRSVLQESISPACGNYETGSCPIAEDAARHLINLPTHLRVTPQDVESICAALVQAFPQSRDSSEGAERHFISSSST
jgi:dTDP-4-amino-4,6-dideoxygalactose transaminase